MRRPVRRECQHHHALLANRDFRRTELNARVSGALESGRVSGVSLFRRKGRSGPRVSEGQKTFSWKAKPADARDSVRLPKDRFASDGAFKRRTEPQFKAIDQLGSPPHLSFEGRQNVLMRSPVRPQQSDSAKYPRDARQKRDYSKTERTGRCSDDQERTYGGEYLRSDPYPFAAVSRLGKSVDLSFQIDDLLANVTHHSRVR
jgi:hypothetical protein